MTKKFRQQVRGRTRDMIRLMNHGGAHWTQMAFKKGRGDKTSYCLLGGAHQIIFGRRMENNMKRFDEVVYTTFLSTLAEQIDAKRFASMERDRDEPYERWNGKTGAYEEREPTEEEVKERNQEFYQDCENVVMEFNDKSYNYFNHSMTTWADVKAMLQSTIDALK